VVFCVEGWTLVGMAWGRPKPGAENALPPDLAGAEREGDGGGEK